MAEQNKTGQKPANAVIEPATAGAQTQQQKENNNRRRRPRKPQGKNPRATENADKPAAQAVPQNGQNGKDQAKKKPMQESKVTEKSVRERLEAAQAEMRAGGILPKASGTPGTQKNQNQNQNQNQNSKPARQGAPKKRNPQRGGAGNRGSKRTPVRIIPLGGLNEIGKNMTLYESMDDMFIVDCGIAFPDEDMLGVDLVIPDFSFVEANKDKIRGVVVTHGHEDHIGGLPYLLKQVNVPIYCTRLTAGLIEVKLKEHGLLNKAKLIVVKPGDVVNLGCMSVEFIRVNHSIPDACAMAITTPAGVIIQTGDFKVDYTPIESEVIDLARFGELGSKGVLALLADSTNAERPGATQSERTVGDSLDKLFKQAGNRRIIVATFASNIHRVQQIIDSSVKYGRKVAVSGRSMINVVGIANELGYLNIPEGVLIDIDMIGRYMPEQVVLITTGSQGEPMSALSRMAMGDHRKVTVTPQDYIIISATPIPGNEKFVGKIVNELMRLGAEVIYEKMYEIHVSGHACQDELKLMQRLVNPKFFIPVHGEYKHLKKHANLALSMGMAQENIFITDIGKVIETDGQTMKFAGTVPAGRVFVDGLGVGDVGSIVLRDRKRLGEDGLIIVVATIDASTGDLLSGPDIVSRGFVYVRESEEMMKEARGICRDVLEGCRKNNVHDWSNIKQKVKDELGSYLYSRTKRSPMILPIIQDI